MSASEWSSETPLAAAAWREWANWILDKADLYMWEEGCWPFDHTTCFAPASQWGYRDGTPAERAMYAYFIAEFMESEK